MVGSEFGAVRRRLFELHAARDYRAALRLAEAATDEYPGHLDQTTFWRACLHARLGDHEGALGVLEEGRDRGLWWPVEMLENDADLADVRTNERFRAIVAHSVAARASAPEHLPADPLVREPDDRPAAVAVVLLHGRGESADDMLDHWTTLPRAVVIVPRSTQVYGMRIGSWDDADRAEADVARAVETARGMAALDGVPLIVAGFSQGAALAIVLAARASLPGGIGFVAVAPSAGWARALIAADAPIPAMRGCVLAGDLDPRREDVEALALSLNERGAEVRVEILPGLGHEYPPDFADRLAEMVDWVRTGT